MKKKNRRVFLGQMLKGAAIGVLSVFPGTFFNRGLSFAAREDESEKDTLESVLKRVTKSNLYRELNAAKLMPEEKLAIAAVKEIPRDELNEAMEKIRQGGPVAAAGRVCGFGCGGGCGTICGSDCPAATDAIGVVDRKGELRIKSNMINKSKLLSTLEKALELIK